MKTVISKKIVCGIFFVCLLLFMGGGCVSLVSYRNTKAQMIYSELLVAQQGARLDSLQLLYDELLVRVGGLGDSEVNSEEVARLKSQLSKLQVEYLLIKQELDDFKSIQGGE